MMAIENDQKKAYYKDNMRIDVMEDLIYTLVICLCGFR